MKTPRLTRHTTERMLRGHPTGPPHLARLLTAAATPPPTTQHTHAETAALTAYRNALHTTQTPQQRNKRRLPALISLKATLIAIVILLTSGVAMAATARHLSAPHGNGHPHHTQTPAVSNKTRTRIAPSEPVRPAPPRHTPRPWHSSPAHRRPESRQKNREHPSKTPKAEAKGTPAQPPAARVRPPGVTPAG